MDKDDGLFNIIGRLYSDMINAQRIIEHLQKQLQDKDREIIDLTGKLQARD